MSHRQSEQQRLEHTRLTQMLNDIKDINDENNDENTVLPDPYNYLEELTTLPTDVIELTDEYITRCSVPKCKQLSNKVRDGSNYCLDHFYAVLLADAMHMETEDHEKMFEFQHKSNETLSCFVPSCDSLSIDNFPYCEEHRKTFCEGITWY